MSNPADSLMTELAKGLQAEDYLEELAVLDPRCLDDKDSLALDIMTDLAQRLALAEEVVELVTQERDNARALVLFLTGQLGDPGP